MALYHFSNVVTRDLLFYYDAANPKSWRGAPTTNILENNLSAFNDIVGNSTKTVIGPNEVKWVNNGAGITVVRLYVPLASLTNAQTYGVSVYVKDLVGTASLDWCDVAVTGTPSLTNTAGRLQGTSSRSVYDSTYRFLDVTLTTGGMMTLYDPQIDSVNYVTPYVAPTTSRSSSQVLLDLTNLNSITATSLTYATNNTFTFNGSSNQIDVASNLGTLTSYTISFWAKRDAENRMPVAARIGTPFYWFGDNSWRYTHSGVGGEYYYPKPTSIPLGTWGHYCVVYNGSNVSIYRQGVFQGSQNTTGTADWTNGMRIGFWAGGAGYYWQGNIDSVSMYNRALSGIEVAQNFNAMRGRYGL
jgi:hypothetical protein